jgi:phage recombination protein Bet
MASAETTIATREPAKRSVLLAMASRFGMEAAAFEATVRATCGCAGATREEFAAFLLVANEYGLNPVTREIYAFPKKGGGIQPIVGVDGWMRMANAHPEFDGLEVDFQHDDAGKLVSATARVHRKDRTHAVVVTEYLAECYRNTDPWKMPHRMLRHKAAIQGIRYAFGFAGIMEPDEAEGIVERPAVAYTPEPRAVQQLPALSADEWKRQLAAWRSAVESGKMTPADILAIVQTRWAVTNDQADTIMLLGATVAPDGEVIEAVAVDRGDAWEPPVGEGGGAA